MTDLPVVPLPGSEAWRTAYEWAEVLEARFPNQGCEDFAYACSENSFGPITEDNGIVNLDMRQQGENDESEWIWLVTMQDGTKWKATGGCDYTGWDCQSELLWEQTDA